MILMIERSLNKQVFITEICNHKFRAPKNFNTSFKNFLTYLIFLLGILQIYSSIFTYSVSHSSFGIITFDAKAFLIVNPICLANGGGTAFPT